jgi:hypothetical protein
MGFKAGERGLLLTLSAVRLDLNPFNNSHNSSNEFTMALKAFFFQAEKNPPLLLFTMRCDEYQGQKLNTILLCMLVYVTK